MGSSQRTELLYQLCGFFCRETGRLVFSPHLYFYSVIYLDQHGLVGLCFVLGIIIQLDLVFRSAVPLLAKAAPELGPGHKADL